MTGRAGGLPMFEFPVAAADLLAERTAQIVSWGTDPEVVAAVGARVDDVWRDGPGGWTFEWSSAATALEREGRMLDASRAFAAARFPCLATPARVTAYRRHLELFLDATAGEPEREVLPVPYRGSTVAVPVHRYAADDPVATVVVTGGVDTWKTELHRFAAGLSRHGRLEVVAFDMPGTGELPVPLAGDSDEIYRGVVDHVRNGRPTGVLGLSFGGHWAAKVALTGGADFAVDIGGPTGASEPPDGALAVEDVEDPPNGMSGILAHALGLAGMPTVHDALRLLPQFSLYQQLARADGRLAAPLLAVNGTDDLYVPTGDVAVFESFADATVWLVAGAGHCAFERFGDVRRYAVSWIHDAARRTTATAS